MEIKIALEEYNIHCEYIFRYSVPNITNNSDNKIILYEKCHYCIPFQNNVHNQIPLTLSIVIPSDQSCHYKKRKKKERKKKSISNLHAILYSGKII